MANYIYMNKHATCITIDGENVSEYETFFKSNNLKYSEKNNVWYFPKERSELINLIIKKIPNILVDETIYN